MRYIKGMINNNRGSSLPLVLVVLVVVSVLGMTLIGIATSTFKMTRIDGDVQSAYYIAEAGITTTLDLINVKVDHLYDHVNSPEDFFNELEGFMSNPFIVDNFNTNFGRVPIATTTVNGQREANSKNADYTLTSVGKIGNSTRTVTTTVTINWNKGEESSNMGDVFIYGPHFSFTGSNINGEGGTIVSGGLNTHDLNGGSTLNVSNLYFGGSVNMNGGSASFGSQKNPGNIYVNGNLNLWSGTRNVYGDVYINGNFSLKDARMYGNVYVNGDLELGWTPQIHQKIFYTGTLVYPTGYPGELLAKVVKVDHVPTIPYPIIDIGLKDDFWYSSNGYTIRGGVSEASIPNNTKMLVDNYYSNSHTSPSGDTIIVSKGDIDIRGWRHITGVLIAPNGSVRLDVASFTGVIISKDGLIASGGGWNINMKRLTDFFTQTSMPITINGGIDSGGGSETGGGSNERVVIKNPTKEK
ncbi:PilX N-terminal domain-containing pilus assembly protein [Alkaliphilus transvaalensis]|uniref:PilX N-terminal domain-containing pilus assembly protein n=1 Tax=Alkaliphilus transvaalensis TaxID=114628 RepID=UPI00047EB7DC|nr:hypothetical protein [Alkaliphilus transvaalensis]